MPGKKAPPLKLSTVNRMVLIVRAKQPLLDWIINFPVPMSPKAIPTLEELRASPDVFLIPESDTLDAAWAFVRKMADVFLATELESWYRDALLNHTRRPGRIDVKKFSPNKILLAK